MKKFLQAKMKNRLKDEVSDFAKWRKRDKSKVLLSANLDKIIQEESKTNSNLNQVGMTPCSSGGEKTLRWSGLRQEAQLWARQRWLALQGQEGQDPQVGGGRN